MELEHDEIMENVGRLLFTDPNTLLPQHRHLLDLDFKNLGASSSTDRQYWLANVESAINAFQSLGRQSPLPQQPLSPSAVSDDAVLS